MKPILYIDEQLPPQLAPWLSEAIPDVEAYSIQYLGLRQATDREIFLHARTHGAVILTKDDDYVKLLESLGSPPLILLLELENASVATTRHYLKAHLEGALALLADGQTLIRF